MNLECCINHLFRNALGLSGYWLEFPHLCVLGVFVFRKSSKFKPLTRTIGWRNPQPLFSSTEEQRSVRIERLKRGQPRKLGMVAMTRQMRQHQVLRLAVKVVPNPPRSLVVRQMTLVAGYPLFQRPRVRPYL